MGPLSPSATDLSGARAGEWGVTHAAATILIRLRRPPHGPPFTLAHRSFGGEGRGVGGHPRGRNDPHPTTLSADRVTTEFFRELHRRPQAGGRQRRIRSTA